MIGYESNETSAERDPFSKPLEGKKQARSELDQAVVQGARAVEELGAGILKLLSIHVDKLRDSFRESLLTTILVTWSVTFAAIFSAVMAVRLALGLCGALAEAFGGRTWAGDLAGGLLSILAIVLLVTVIRHQTRRKALKVMKRKYASAVRDAAETPCE